MIAAAPAGPKSIRNNDGTVGAVPTTQAAFAAVVGASKSATSISGWSLKLPVRTSTTGTPKALFVKGLSPLPPRRVSHKRAPVTTASSGNAEVSNETMARVKVLSACSPSRHALLSMPEGAPPVFVKMNPSFKPPSEENRAAGAGQALVLIRSSHSQVEKRRKLEELLRNTVENCPSPRCTTKLAAARRESTTCPTQTTRAQETSREDPLQRCAARHAASSPKPTETGKLPPLSLRQCGLLGTDRGARELRQTVYPRAGASSVSFLQRQTDKRRVKIQPVATNGGNNLTVCGHFCEA